MEESPDWQLFKPDFLSPTRLLNALYGAQPRYLDCISFDSGYWTQQCKSLVELAELASAKDWAIQLAPVFTNFVDSSYMLIDEVRLKDGILNPHELHQKPFTRVPMLPHSAS